MPHRDFTEPYSGALTLVHAVAMDWFGVRLASLRWVLFTAYVLWIPCIWGILRRVLPLSLAAFGTLATAAFTIPNYSASMPSWYNLFLATGAAFCVLRWWDTRRPVWAVLAGLLTGASIIIKIVGLYLVAGVLMAFALLEQEDREPDPSGSRLYSMGISLCAAAFGILVLRLLNTLPDPSTFLNLGAPVAGLCALIAFREWRAPAAAFWPRTRMLLGAAAPFLAGVAIPVILYALPYASQGALQSLWDGVFVLPRMRLGSQVLAPPRLWSLVFLVLLPLLVWVGRHWLLKARSARLGALAAMLLAILVLSAHEWGFVAVWVTIHQAPALVGLLTVGMLLATNGGQWSGRVEVLVLLAVMIPCALIQFPFAAPAYVLYVVPLAVMLMLLAADRPGFLTRGELMLTLAFYMMFMGLRTHGGALMEHARYAEPGTWTTPLGLERGGILVRESDAATYQALSQFIHSKTGGGAFYAFPDGAELYFLTGLENPTPNIYDMFTPPMPDAVRLRNIDEWGVNTVAIRLEDCCWAEAPSAALLAELERRFPGERVFGDFMVRWKE